jgi:hypothetical protein
MKILRMEDFLIGVPLTSAALAADVADGGFPQ